MQSLRLTFSVAAAVLAFAGTLDSHGAAPSPEEQVRAVAKKIQVEPGFDEKNARWAAIVTRSSEPRRLPDFDPHLEAVFAVAREFNKFVGEKVEYERSVAGESEETTISSESDFMLPDIGRLVFYTTLKQSMRKNGADVSTGSWVRTRTELVKHDGRTMVLQSHDSKAGSSLTVDPMLRGGIIQAFYAMGYKELAHRRSTASTKSGPVETHAWLYSLDLPTVKATAKKPEPKR